VVTAADVIALGVLSQLLHAGRAVPDDFRVIGFDGIGAGTLAHPPLTTVRQPVEEMTLAIRDLIDGGEGPERDAPTHGHRFAPVFIEGETSP
jgi:LacI family transcriptional regulator